MTAPDFLAILPLLVLAGGAALTLAALSIRRHYPTAFVLAGLTLASAFVLLPVSWNQSPHPVGILFEVDAFGLFFVGLIVLAAFIVAHFSVDYFRDLDDSREEFFVLLLLSTLGASALALSSHFVSFFVSLELLSVPLYAMIAYTVRRETALEASAKYLLLAAASSAFLLFGMALIYAEMGTMGFRDIASNFLQMGEAYQPVVLYSGIAMILVGVGFKLSLFPFHWWAGDVYQGAPLPVAALIATISKAAVVAVALRFMGEMHAQAIPAVEDSLILMAAGSMIVGNLLALSQRNVKRLLGYSSIAHLGYLTIAFLVGGSSGAEAAALYMAAYTVTILGAFGTLSVLSTSRNECQTIEQLRGLFARKPWAALLLTAMMLSLAGIPLTAGFMGKFFILAAGVGQSYFFLAIILVASSAVGLYYYLRVIWTLFQPEEVPTTMPRFAEFSAFALIILAASVLFVGVYPGPIVNLLRGAVSGLGF